MKCYEVMKHYEVMKYKYAKRIAIYSTAFGILSFFWIVSVLPPGIDNSWYIASFVFFAIFIVFEALVNRRINNEKSNIQIPMIVLFLMWGLIQFQAILAITEKSFIIFLIFQLFL